MRRCAAVILAVALATSASFGASAGEHDSFVLRAGRILPVAKGLPEVIENGVIVVRDGRIVAIGSDVPIPPDLRVIDLPDAVVAPGLVAASGDWAGTHAGDEAVSGAYHAVDSFDRYGDYRDILATGVTTIHVNPGWHRLVAGRGAVVRLGGYHDERVLSSASDLTINLVADALGPPDLQTFLIPPSGDRGVTPQQPQRPFSRAGQLLAIREALAAAESKEGRGNVHLSMFREAWNQQSPLRIHAQRAEDIINAAAFLSGQKRTGYIVGGIEAAQAASQLAATGTRLVYTIDAPLRSTQSNLGNDPFALAGDDRNLARLAGVTFALGLSPDLPVTDLRLAGAAARRSGLSEQQVLASLTRIPAEILGVGDRVGSLAVGLEADLVAYTGHPLEVTSHVERVYTRGKLVYKRTPPPAMVVRGGTIWLGPDNWLRDGAVLVEDGRITAVGKRVPHPVGARVIDAGPDGFIAPGMIDAFGHLGLEGDRGALPANLSLTPLVGAPTLEATRVAKAGVTTVVTAPYAFDNNGSQVAAIRTYGEGRQDRIVAPTAGVVLSVRGSDAKAIPGRLNGRITAAKRYLETWQKYEKDLAEWEQKRASGQLPAATRPAEEVVTQTPSVDPVSGTWQAPAAAGSARSSSARWCARKDQAPGWPKRAIAERRAGVTGVRRSQGSMRARSAASPPSTRISMARAPSVAASGRASRTAITGSSWPQRSRRRAACQATSGSGERMRRRSAPTRSGSWAEGAAGAPGAGRRARARSAASITAGLGSSRCGRMASRGRAPPRARRSRPAARAMG